VKNLDKIFKEKLDNGTSPYSDQLWSKIENQLDTPQNNRPGFPFIYTILGSLLMLLGVFFAYQWLSLDANELENNISQANLIQEKPLKANTIEVNAFDNPQAPIENEINLDTKASEKTSSQKQIKSNSSQSFSQNIRASENSTNVLGVQKSNEPFTNPTAFVPPTQSKQLNTPMPLVELSQTIASKKSNLGNQQILELEPISSIDLLNYNFLQANEAPKYSSNPGDCEGKYVKQYGLSMDLYFSPELAFRDLNAVDEKFNDYLIARERSEAPTLSYSAGFRLSYHNASGFTARTGLNYTQINEQFDYIEEYETTTTIITETTNPETGEINRDTTFQSDINQIDQSTMNSFKSFDIPLLIGLALPINDRLDININTGVYLNASFSARGKILSPSELEPVWISSNNGDIDVFKTRLGLSYYGSIGLLHELSPGLDLLVEPNLRYYSQSFTLSGHPLTQDYVKIGVLTGLRYKF